MPGFVQTENFELNRNITDDHDNKLIRGVTPKKCFDFYKVISFGLSHLSSSHQVNAITESATYNISFRMGATWS